MYGLGDGQMVNGVYVMSTPITTDTVTSSGQNVYQDAAGNILNAPAAATWIPGVSNTVVGIGAAAFLLLLMMGMRR